MSNSVADVYASCPGEDAPRHGREELVYEAIHAKISPRDEVLRLLPTRDRRMVGAWCFADVYGPRSIWPGGSEAAGDAMHVAPHPHTGLQTVSWLMQGEVTHRDSLGTTATVVPGRAAVMTAGAGIAHSEDSEDTEDTEDTEETQDAAGARRESAMLHGAQLWVALPDAQRWRERAFVLCDPAPFLEGDGVVAQVFMGSLGDVTGAPAYTPLVGAELTPRGGRPGRLPLDAAYEHVLIPLTGWAQVNGARVGPGQALYLGVDRSTLEVGLSDDARVLLLGGSPFEEWSHGRAVRSTGRPKEIVMWWNFVARTHEEIEQARAQWSAGGDERFGEVTQYPTDERLAAPPLPNVRLRPRLRHGSG